MSLPALPTALPTGSPDFETLRERYIETGLYLGTHELEQSLRSKMDWEKNGNEDVLVDKASLEGNTPIELELIFVAEISSSCFYMLADGGYTPRVSMFGQGTPSKFENVKASCFLMAPRVEPWKTDFDNVLATLRWLEEEKATEGTKRIGLFKDERRTMPKIVHRLFTNRETLSTLETGLLAAITERSLTIEHWPVPTHNSIHLEGIQRTHIVFPIPAYDIDDKLIPPEQYRQKLCGALVECHVSISHWFIQRDNGEGQDRDAYNANLRKLKILRAPRAPPASPRKRKIFINMDGV